MTIGIERVELVNVNNMTLGNIAYTDFSCSQLAYLENGVAHVLTVNTVGNNNYKVSAWIDFNNNGTFTSNELVLNSTGVSVHQSAVIIPAGSTLNQVLRMRVSAELNIAGPPDPTPCGNLINGEIEDYGILIGNNSSITSSIFPGSSITHAVIVE